MHLLHSCLFHQIDFLCFPMYMEKRPSQLQSYRNFFFFLGFYLFIFGERGRREGEKHQCIIASHSPPLGTQPMTQAFSVPHSIHRATPARARNFFYVSIQQKYIRYLLCQITPAPAPPRNRLTFYCSQTHSWKIKSYWFS